MAAKNTGPRQQLQLKQSLNGGKSLIDKDNLSDEDFDRLVIDISNIVGGQDNLVDAAAVAVASCEQRFKTHQSASSIEGSQVGEEFCYDLNNELPNTTNQAPNNSSYGRPNQPKRPMNAFMVWGRAIRREIHLRFSNVQNALLSKALGRVWRSLDSATKEPYVRKANLIKANHRRDYPDYRYQPRRLQERERNKSNKEPATSSMIVGATNEPTSHYLVPTNFRAPATQYTQAPALGASQTIYTAATWTAPRMHQDADGRVGGELEAQPMVALNQCYVSDFMRQDNNHIESPATGSIYYHDSNDVQHLKSHHYDEYQQQQQQQHQHQQQHNHHHYPTLITAKQHSVTATTTQVYSCLDCHRFPNGPNHI